jgi:nucleoside-diphosphate-sugar epimerase
MLTSASSDRRSATDIVRGDLDYICGNLAREFGQLEGSRILITGGAGFLGYYLVQAILHYNRAGSAGNREARSGEMVAHRQPIQVTVYDNYMRGVPEWLTEQSSDPNLTLVKHDITQPLPTEVDDFSHIIHAASIASPIYYRLHPIETMDANVNGLRYLLEYARAKAERFGTALKGFLFFSTSEIYGDPTPGNIPTPESYRGNVSCTGPRACYDESKRYGETLCVNFARQYDLPVAVARPFNNYGPGLKITDRRVLPDFARDALAGRDIVMLSDGSPTRTFCYVADAVIGYYKILINGERGEAYNIGVDRPEISIAELAERVVTLARELWNYQGRVVHQTSSDQDYLTDNPNRRCPVIDKARDHLGYSPGISLDEGLARSLIWYRDHQYAEEA